MQTKGMGSNQVFPTPVGMVRCRTPFSSSYLCFPHARGDGPKGGRDERCRHRFSPRPWGWSAAQPRAHRQQDVFPTPVGMVRRCASLLACTAGFPHARGDGPGRPVKRLRRQAFSPRPWGWSDNMVNPDGSREVFPTPVGMVRNGIATNFLAVSFPHARGDGPVNERRAWSMPMFSPRPWGWSAVELKGRAGKVVFPTPVGMVRMPYFFHALDARFPHARGDGPPRRDLASAAHEFSPRPWGWSGVHLSEAFCLEVFPTPVGMVRSPDTRPALPLRFPHARGDGPMGEVVERLNGKFSPRPWGWSESHWDLVGPWVVFPTPVGMVRGTTVYDDSVGRFPHARGDGP